LLLCKCGDRNLAATLELAEKGTLCRYGDPGVPIMHSFANRVAEAVIVRPCSYRKGALPRRRKHDVGGKPISYAVGEAQPYEAGNGQHDGSPIGVGIQLGEAGIDVAAKIHDLQIGPGT